MNCGDEGCRSPIFTDVTDQFLHRKAHATIFAGVTGIEPTTVNLTGRCSDQLKLHPNLIKFAT